MNVQQAQHYRRAPLPVLIAACTQGDEDALREVYTRNRGWAFDLARALLNDDASAEDAVQESFLAAFVRLGELRSPQAFPAWLRQIIRTQCNRVRRTQRDATCECVEMEHKVNVTAVSALAHEELREKVRGLVEELPPAQRAATRLYYLEERTCREVAGRLAVPEGTVKRRLHDARNRLRTMLLPDIDDYR